MIQQKQRQKREERILLRLHDLNFATQRQLQIIENLGGTRNAHRILHRMEKDRVISSIRREQKIYYLSNKGKEQIGSNQPRLGRDNIKHTLMRNDLYIKLGIPKGWKKEARINRNDKTLLVADAMYTKNNKFYFVEIDNVQTMRTNYDKIKKYKEVSDMIYRQYDHYPTLIWYTLSDVRKSKLKNTCEKQGIKYEVI